MLRSNRATAILSSLALMAGSISVPASAQNSAIQAGVQMPAFICGSVAAGCVLPVRAKPVPVATPAPAAPAVVPQVESGGFPTILALLGAAAAIAGIILIADDDEPASP